MKKRKKRINRILEIILWICSIVTIYPMLMVLLTSFKSKGEAAYMSVSLPSEWHFENYLTVIEKDFSALWGTVFLLRVSPWCLIVALSCIFEFCHCAAGNGVVQYFL